MDKTADIKHIWRERFGDSRQWMTEVFPRVYRENEAITATVNGRVVSSLLLRRMTLTFNGKELNMGYIYGAATAKSYQGQGLMSGLVIDALAEARRRGDAIVTLMPARRRLYGFYARFGFSTLFFIDEKRYTAAHIFTFDSTRYTVDLSVSDPEELAKAYRRLSANRPSTTIHDADDFKAILIDNDLDHGLVAIVRHADNGRIASIGLAVSNNDRIAVRELVAEDSEAEEAVLATFTRERPGLMTVIESYPQRQGVRYHARGMARIVNAEAVLTVMAQIKPDLTQTIRITDPIIRDNNGIYKISGGKVTKLEESQVATDVNQHKVIDIDSPESAERRTKIDLDVDITTFTSIIFSAPEIGDIFNLPTARPFMSLMLS